MTFTAGQHASHKKFDRNRREKEREKTTNKQSIEILFWSRMTYMAIVMQCTDAERKRLFREKQQQQRKIEIK